MTNTCTSVACQAAQPATPTLRRHLTTLRSLIATWRDGSWRERMLFRWQLRQMAKDNPHLIDDIGLTKRHVEAEIAKRFWQV